jgi:hypothetical protein
MTVEPLLQVQTHQGAPCQGVNDGEACVHGQTQQQAGQQVATSRLLLNQMNMMCEHMLLD